MDWELSIKHLISDLPAKRFLRAPIAPASAHTPTKCESAPASYHLCAL